MPTATIVRTWTDAQNAYMAVQVSGDDADANTEYIGQVPLEWTVQEVALDQNGQSWNGVGRFLFADQSPEAQREILVAAAKAERDRSLGIMRPAAATDLGHTGEVTL